MKYTSLNYYIIEEIFNLFWQYRHRESSFDARSKKLAEVTKTGEIAIETLSRQRDALELRYLCLPFTQQRSKITVSSNRVVPRLHKESGIGGSFITFYARSISCLSALIYE